VALSNFEVYALVKELKALEGAYVNNFQQIDKGIFKMRIGGETLIVWPPETVHITNYSYQAMPPSSLVMHVKKQVKGKRIEHIEQYKFDRVIVFSLSNGFKIVVEMFSRGNIILVGPDGKTDWAMRYETWSDRVIKPKKPYNYPMTTRLNPITMTFDEFDKIFTQKDIIRSLVKGINMSPAYLEEVCARAGIDKNASDCDRKILFEKIKEFLNSEMQPGIQGKPVPIKLITRKEPFVPKDSFNQALDEFYFLPERKEAHDRTLEHILNEQKSALENMKEEMERSKKIGDKIYEHMNELQLLFEKINEMRKEGMEWDRIERVLNIKINPKDKTVEIDMS